MDHRVELLSGQERECTVSRWTITGNLLFAGLTVGSQECQERYYEQHGHHEQDRAQQCQRGCSDYRRMPGNCVIEAARAVHRQDMLLGLRQIACRNSRHRMV